MRRVRTIRMIFLGILSAASSPGPLYSEPYTPEQAISVFHQAIRNAIDPSMSNKFWLSLSLIGAVAESSDLSIVNDLANFCPERTPVIDSFTRVRRLDAIYEKVLAGLTGPLRPETAEYRAARDYLFNPQTKLDTPEYAAYEAHSDAFAEALSNYFAEKDTAKKVLLQRKVNKAVDKWSISGYRGEVEAAMWQVELGETKFGLVKNGRRARILKAFRNAGLKPSDVDGAYRAPLSELSPPVDTWSNDTGWATFSYSSQQIDSSYDGSYSQSRGFGGLSLGFINLVASGGGGDSNEHSVREVKEFSYGFDLKRVQIRRPWFDGDVFFEPQSWTWKKNANTTTFPRVAEGLDENGQPKEPVSAVYDNQSIGCPLLPLDLIIARKRTLTATVSKADYQKIVESGSVSGGGSLFGIFGGGGSRSWTTTKIRETETDVTFKVEAPSIAVIGVISEVVPTLPSPNVADTWPPEAWIQQ
jgi:hypothetical protein